MRKEEKETIYARWFSGDISEEELDLLKKEGSIEDLEKIKEATNQWRIPAYDKTAGLKGLKSTIKPQPVIQYNVFKWAAVFILSISSIAVLYLFIKTDKPKEIYASQKSVEKHNLMDGSIATLNDGSTISYVEKNWNSKRAISLEGEAYFEVIKGSQFKVFTDKGNIQVLGTAFTVRAWNNKLYVECYEGSVEVTNNDHKVILSPRESVNFIGSAVPKVNKISNPKPLWLEGKSRFYEEDAGSVFDELERQYGITVIRPKLKKSFNGLFEHDNLERALINVCTPLGLSFKIAKDQKTVTIE